MNKIKKILIVAIFAIGTIASVSAQEFPIYNQYHFHGYLINPALAGAAECTHFMLTHKQQWIGVKDAPMTTVLSFQTRTQKRLGIGAYLFNDRNGYSYQQGGQVSIAYHIPMSTGNRYSKRTVLDRQLSFGVSGKVYRYDFNEDMLEEARRKGELVQEKTGFFPNANVGVFYQSYNFFTGLSVTNIMPVKIDIFGDNEPLRPLTAFYQIGYAFDMQRDVQLEPSAVFHIDGNARKQLDLSLRVLQHLDRDDISWWAGVTVKQNFDKEYKSLVLLPNFTVRLGKFRFGYAVNLDLNKLFSNNYGSHELMIGYSFCSTKQFCR
jgi:type IX secretion system PorP/SprF family membrane protein